MHYDVIIVGAGPSGSSAALRCAELGIEKVLLLDRTEFPRAKPCAGGIAPASETFLNKVGWEKFLHLEPSAAMETVRFVSPDGIESITGAGNVKAKAINRRIFDTALRDEAISKGAEFIGDFTLRDLITGYSYDVLGVTDGTREFFASVVVIATGGHNKTFRDKYFPQEKNVKPMTSRIAWYDGLQMEPGMLEMLFDPMVLPHYGWVFPEGNGRVNIGICMLDEKLKGKSVNQVFDDFMEKYYRDRLKKAVQVGPAYNYPIRTSSKVGTVVAKRMLLVGEAARLCDPATAEGISFAMESGYLAAGAIKRCLENNNNPGYLQEYQKNCEKAFNRRLFLSTLFRWFVGTRLFAFLVRVASHPIIKKMLGKIMG